MVGTRNYGIYFFFSLFLLASGYAQGQQLDKEKQRGIYKKEREFFYLVTQYNKEGKLIKKDTLVFSTYAQLLHPQHGQTKSTWKRKGEIRKSITGITENDTVVWIHPPRFGEYRILELSPFPMVAYPIKAGSSWQWDLEVGGEWGAKEWLEWKGAKLFRSYYKNLGKQTLKTKFGTLDCYKIDCVGDDDFVRTKLTFYFNQQYGFVKLEYENINQTTMQLELINETLVSLPLN